MTSLGSSAPFGFPDWVLSIPTRLVAEGIAFDGLRPGPGSAMIEATFTGRIISRTTGDFIADGFAVGQAITVGGSASNNGPYQVIAALTATEMTLSFPAAFIAEGPTADVQIDGAPPASAFSVWIGTQNKDRWTPSNSVVFVPSSGAEEKPAAFHSSNAERRHLVTVRWSLTAHVWGIEPDLESFPGMLWDAERLRSAYQIWENVSRVFKGSAYGFGRIESIDAWDQETPVLRYGESLAMRYSVPIPLYDWPRTRIPTPQLLRPKTGEPKVKGPGEL